MAERDPATPPPGEPAAAQTRTVVLLVDDTPDTLAMLTDALEEAGFTALIATGGEAALAICGRVTPDVILLDAMMPGMDGFETCRRLKASGAVADVPVIFMTALSDTSHIVQGFGAGGVDYVTKPIVLDELFARLRVHLSNARAARSARLALDTTGRFLLAVDRLGSLLWASPQAARLLAGLAPEAVVPEGVVPSSATADEPARGTAAALPAAVRPAVATAVQAGGGAFPPIPLGPGAAGTALDLAFVGPVRDGEFLFQLLTRDERRDEDVLRERHGLTAREAEVLLWIARGKSNRDIADILALSPRTVNKHLEGIYTKLGVENRASAAVMAAGALGRGG